MSKNQEQNHELLLGCKPLTECEMQAGPRCTRAQGAAPGAAVAHPRERHIPKAASEANLPLGGRENLVNFSPN